MSEQKKKDDLADALAALAAGEHHEEPPASGSGIDSQASDAVHLGGTPTPLPAKPQRPGPPAPRAASGAPQPVARSGAPVPRQAAPPTPAQSTLRTPPAPASIPRPAAAQGPPASGLRPPAPSAKAPVRPPAAPAVAAPMRPASPNSKVRPATPKPGVPARAPAPPPPPIAPPVQQFVAPEPPSEERIIDHEAEVEAEAQAIAHVVEDDDTLNMPAPSAEMLAHRPRPPRARGELLSRTVGFKQTLIPILLTMGVMLAGIAAWSFALGEESPVAAEGWITVAVLGIGAVMLVLAVITMLQVRSQLNRTGPVT